MDETTVKCLEESKETGRTKSYEWTALSGRFESKQMALYFYKDGRKHENVENIIGKESQCIIHWRNKALMSQFDYGETRHSCAQTNTDGIR